MALDLDPIRAAARRVAASHGLELVNLEFQGGGKHRILQIFIEKNAEGRAKLAELAGVEGGLPSGVDIEHLAGVTHEDCEAFSRDFGTYLDVEQLVPGTTEYTLEVSSPGLDRRLYTLADYQRFRGSQVKLSTVEPVSGNRHWHGKLAEVNDDFVVLDLSAAGKQGKGKKKAPAVQAVEIRLANIDKANLVPEI